MFLLNELYDENTELVWNSLLHNHNVCCEKYYFSIQSRPVIVKEKAFVYYTQYTKLCFWLLIEVFVTCTFYFANEPSYYLHFAFELYSDKMLDLPIYLLLSGSQESRVSPLHWIKHDVYIQHVLKET